MPIGRFRQTPFVRPVYGITGGIHSYYAVGENFVETAGSGLARTTGHLTVQVFSLEEIFKDSDG